MNITLNQFNQLDNDFVNFCKQNNCLDEAYLTLKDTYKELEKLFTTEDFDLTEDFRNNNISVGHLEDMNDIHLCNSCYDHYGGCRHNRPHNKGVCTQPIDDDVLEMFCKSLDSFNNETGDCHGFYRHICRDIVMYYHTPFVRCNEY